MRLKFATFPSVTPPDTASDHEYCIGNIFSNNHTVDLVGLRYDLIPSAFYGRV